MSASAEKKLTPLMQQYFEIKKEYPETILMFQVGDFYEMFFDDAKKASSFLGIALTARGKNKGEPIPLCGVPLHALDHYLSKLVSGGFCVAICDQLEEPTPGKVVKRGITQVLTPGTITDSKLLDAKSASYLFSFFPAKKSLGLVFGELLTAQLFATVIPADSQKTLETELNRFFPDEIILPTTKLASSFETFFKKQGYFVTFEQFSVSDLENKKMFEQWKKAQFSENICNQIETKEDLQDALATFYGYLQKTQQAALGLFKQINFYEPDDFLIVDHATQKNLELVKNNYDGGRKHSLLSVLDRAATSMGSRTIKKWVLRPLVQLDQIQQRQEVVGAFICDNVLLQKLSLSLKKVGDVERVIGRMALGRAQIYDYVHLSGTLCVLPELCNLLSEKTDKELLKIIVSKLFGFEPLAQLLSAAINDESSKDWIIKKGFDKKLDDLRELAENAHGKILEFEEKEKRATKIASLKVRYNHVQGYYIEVTKPNLHLVPDYYIRQQSLVGKERFTTQELKALQNDILRAKSDVTTVEQEVYSRVKEDAYSYIWQLRVLAQALSHLDGLLSLSLAAYENNYICPVFTDGRDILIEDGRHPVVEKSLQNGFIPNSTSLIEKESFWIITGPNMGGKSTYLRQVALICLMAQCGSFVPAAKAKIPILDRVFTRIGASDILAEGKSTFLVEMEETATICSQATAKSLVILDEVGRGTSTFDGLAIAQAVVEYIYKVVKARCLFATHYHELTHLQDDFKGIVSYYTTSKQTESGIVFLHKIVKGIADGSFGLEVAKLALLPKKLIERAHDVLDLLRVGHHTCQPSSSGFMQQNLFSTQNKNIETILQENKKLRLVIEQLQEKAKQQDELLALFSSVDYDNLSPKQAFDLLWKLKK